MSRWKEASVDPVAGERETLGGRGRLRGARTAVGGATVEMDASRDGLVPVVAVFEECSFEVGFDFAGGGRGFDRRVSPALIGFVGSMGKLDRTEAYVRPVDFSGMSVADPKRVFCGLF